MVLAVAAPVGRDVAGVADGQQVQVGCATQLVADLPRGRALTVDAVRVDRVDELDGIAVGEVTAEVERVVEVALDLQHGRAMHDGLGELAERDAPLGHDDRGGHPGLRGVGRCGCGRVAG